MFNVNGWMVACWIVSINRFYCIILICHLSAIYKLEEKSTAIKKKKVEVYVNIVKIQRTASWNGQIWKNDTLMKEKKDKGKIILPIKGKTQ